MNSIFSGIKLPIITFKPQHPHTEQPQKLHKGASEHGPLCQICKVKKVISNVNWINPTNPNPISNMMP